MKVVVPVAGIGAKLRPHTHTQPKPLVPIAGKPILAHMIDELREGGLQEFVFILGYLGDKIEAFLTAQYPDLKMTFIVQDPREGTAHALWVCKEQVEHEEELLVVLGDTIAGFNLQNVLASPESILGVKRVHNPMLFGIAETDANGIITRLVEKPQIPKSNQALVGIYKIKNIPLLFEAIAYQMANNLKVNNEYYLTDALMYMIQKGERMRAIEVDNWFDCGRKETLLEANAILLNTEFYKNKQQPSFPNTIIIPPVSIGKNCKVEHSIIGPYVAIGDNTIVQKAIVSNSIIGSFSELQHVVLKDSIVGNDTALNGLVQSLNIGDNTEINFSKL
jgi:glucose-1-phosphate thymidylyltransferase